jgi:hypothetical protein
MPLTFTQTSHVCAGCFLNPPQTDSRQHIRNLTRHSSPYQQGTKIVNLQRPGLDPYPIWLAYLDVMDVIKEMVRDARVKGFRIKPEFVEVERNVNGEVKRVRAYDHPCTGTRWENAQKAVSR